MHVRNRFAQLPASARDEGARVEAVGAHESQGDDGGGEHAGVDEEDRANAPPVDEESRRGRADESRGVEGGGVQGDGVRHLVLGHELADECLACGRVDRGDRPGGEGEDVLVPQLARARQHDDTDDEGDEAHPRLRALEEAPPGDAVREHARPRGEQDDGQELQGGDDADLRGVVIGENRQYVPVLGNALEPRAGGRNQGSDEPIPVVHVAHRCECCQHARPPSLAAAARAERGGGSLRRSPLLGAYS